MINYIKNAKDSLIEHLNEEGVEDVVISNIHVTDGSIGQLSYYDEESDTWHYCEADYKESDYDDGIVYGMIGHHSMPSYRCDSGSISDYNEKQQYGALKAYHIGNLNDIKKELEDDYDQLVIECMFEQDLL